MKRLLIVIVVVAIKIVFFSRNVGTSTKHRLPLQRAEGQRISRRSLRLMKTGKTQSRRRDFNAKLFSIIRSSSSGRGTIIITFYPF